MRREVVYNRILSIALPEHQIIKVMFLVFKKEEDLLYCSKFGPILLLVIKSTHDANSELEYNGNSRCPIYTDIILWE